MLQARNLRYFITYRKCILTPKRKKKIVWFGFTFQALLHFPRDVWRDETVTLKKMFVSEMSCSKHC